MKMAGARLQNLRRALRAMIFHKSRFAMQIKQDGLMSAKSLSLDQLRVSLSLQHFPTADAGRGWRLGTGHLLRNWINR